MSGRFKSAKFVDPETNEELGVIHVLTPAKVKQNPFSSAWGSHFTDAFLQVITASSKQRWPIDDIHVACYLICKVDKNSNDIAKVSQARIAEELGIDRPRVSRSMKRLTAMGIVFKSKDGRSYHLTPRIAWRGNSSEREEAMKAAPPINIKASKKKEKAA